MLDKFKFFNKDKAEKSKGSSSKSKSGKKDEKTTITPAVNADKSPLGPSSRLVSPTTEPVGATGAQNSPKLAMKSFGKKVLGRKGPIPVDIPTPRQSLQPPTKSQSRSSGLQAPSTGTSLKKSVSHSQASFVQKSDSIQPASASQVGPPSKKKTSTSSSNIVTGSTKTPKGSGLNVAPNASIPGAGTGIPKPGARTSSASNKSSKDESRSSRHGTSSGRSSSQGARVSVQGSTSSSKSHKLTGEQGNHTSDRLVQCVIRVLSLDIVFKLYLSCYILDNCIL